MPVDIHDIETRLWDAADELRANSKLKASEYSIPVLGLIFLRFAEYRFKKAGEELEGSATGRREPSKIEYQAKGVLYLPEEARFKSLLDLPEGANIGQAINDAMTAIEEENEELMAVPHEAPVSPGAAAPRARDQEPGGAYLIVRFS